MYWHLLTYLANWNWRKKFWANFTPPYCSFFTESIWCWYAAGEVPANSLLLWQWSSADQRRLWRTRAQQSTPGSANRNPQGHLHRQHPPRRPLRPRTQAAAAFSWLQAGYYSKDRGTSRQRQTLPRWVWSPPLPTRLQPRLTRKRASAAESSSARWTINVRTFYHRQF